MKEGLSCTEWPTMESQLGRSSKVDGMVSLQGRMGWLGLHGLATWFRSVGLPIRSLLSAYRTVLRTEEIRDCLEAAVDLDRWLMWA